MTKIKEWHNADYTLFENDGEKLTQKWTINIEIQSPDGITNSRLTCVISRALSDSNYLYDEISSSSVSATLTSEESVSTETKEERDNQLKKIKKLMKVAN